MLAWTRWLLPVFLFGCSPDAELADEQSAPVASGEGDELSVASGSQLGPVLIDPPPGAIDIPPNLAALTLRFAAAVQGDGVNGLRLHPSQGPDVNLALGPAVPCLGTGVCYLATPGAVLAPAALYVLTLDADALRLESGKPLPAASTPGFTTAALVDAYGPVVQDLQIAASAGCMQVRFISDEPVRAEVALAVGEQTGTVLMDGFAQKFDASRPMPALPAGEARVTLRAIDRAGNATDAAAVTLALPARTPRLVITEVLANPAGSETTQEFVEIRNLEPGPVSLEGMILEDKTGRDVLPADVLAPDAYAVLVAASYDAADGKDPAPRAGVLLVRVSGRLGSDGFSNSGEPVRLLAADGTVVSQYGGWADVSATAWSGKSVQRVSADACDAPEGWLKTPQTPTPGW